MNDELQAALRAIVERFGIDAVRKALRDFSRDERKRELIRGPGGVRAARKRSGRERLSAVGYVQKMKLPEERAEAIRRAAREFEKRTFLPTFGDVRNFCESYGIDVPRSTSRAAVIPRVFRLLAAMDTPDVETMLDDRLFSGPVELGPIAEAIRGRARQDRKVAGSATGEIGESGGEDDFDAGVPAAVWKAATAEAREALREVAGRRATMSYTELVARIESVDIEPHDSRLAHMLGQISADEDETGGGLLSVVVVHQGGDLRPGAGFFELARARGRDVTDRDRCWLKELEFVHRRWATGPRSGTGRSTELEEGTV